MLLHGRFSNAVFVKRFHLEAEAAAHLDHPNIVPIYEIGQHQGQHYFSMKLVEGRGLDRLNVECQVRNAKWMRRAVKLLATVARAVHYAHQHGVLHRDLKPHNILVDAEDQPHLTDFGLAKLLEQDTGLTLSEAVLGSPAYMSPEQAAGKTRHLTTATDVYSLGAVLYTLLTGRAPFEAPTALETIRQVVEREPARPGLLNAAVDLDLETVCLKCLAKEPERRYGSAEAMAEDLERWQQGEPIAARRVSGPERLLLWCRRKPVVAALATTSAAVFLLGLAGVVWQWRRAESQGRETERALGRAEQQQYAAQVALAQNLVQQKQFKGAREVLADEAMARYRGWEWGWLQRQCHQDLATLPPHGAVTTVAFSPTGKFLVTGNFDHLVRLWNWDEGKIVQIFSGHEGIAGAQPGSFSPDGKRLATFSWDQTVRIWEVATGRELLHLSHPAGVDCAQFSPDGATLASGAMDGVVRLWNAQSGKLLRQTTNGDSVLFLNFSPDGKQLAYAGGPRRFEEGHYDTSVKIWDLAANRVRVLAGHRTTVMGVAFSPDGKTLASCSLDGWVKLWDVAIGRELRGMKAGAGYGMVFTVMFSPDGRKLAVGGTYGLAPRAEILDVASLERVRILEGHSGAVRSLAFSPDGSWIATSSPSDEVRIWAVTNAPDCVTLEGHNAAVWTVTCSADGRRIATGSFDNTAKVWDAATGSPVQTIQVGMPIVSLALSARGTELMTATPDATATVWDVASGHPRMRLQGHAKTVMAVALSADGRWLLTGSKDSTAKLWNATNGALVRTFAGHSNWVLSVAFSPDGRRILTGSADGTAIVWDAASARRLQTLAGHGDWVLSVAFSPGGQRFATGTGTSERKIRLWEAHSGTVLWQAEHADGITGLAFSPDGARLATAAGSSIMVNTFRREFGVAISDVRTGYRLAQVEAHSNSVLSVAFSPDGSRLITGSGDNTARIRTAFPWRADSGADAGGPSLAERIERYKRQQGRAALVASAQAAAATPPRTNLLAAMGEVNLPATPNLRIKPLLPISARDVRATDRQIDLSATYNAALNETWQLVSWLDQVDLNLGSVPQGLQTLGGITFDVRGLIQLRRTAPNWQWAWQTYPEHVRIAVGRKFSRLHVLHATTHSMPDGNTIGTYRLHYAEGNEHPFDIIYGRDLRDWVGPADVTLIGGDARQAVLAWKGDDPSRDAGAEPRSLRLFRRTYTNPHPELEVQGIDFVSAVSKCGPFLVAMTVE